MIAMTSGRLASPGGSGVMNGVTALSIRKMASAASAMRRASANPRNGGAEPRLLRGDVHDPSRNQRRRQRQERFNCREADYRVDGSDDCAYCDSEILNPSQTSVANVPPKPSAIAITAAFMTPSAISRHHRR
jgi:hypothetical protein